MRKVRTSLLASALVAGALAWHPPAGAASGARVEAETFSLPAGTGRVFSDAAASGLRGLLIRKNATANKRIRTAGA